MKRSSQSLVDDSITDGVLPEASDGDDLGVSNQG